MDPLSGDRQIGAAIRAGLYLRISRDRAQHRLAVQRQEEDCRQVAKRLSWAVTGVYIDNGLSASQFATRPRDDYRRLLDDIKAGRLDAVVVWMEDRSHRQVIELAEFMKTSRAAGMTRYASVGTEYDLSDPDQVAILFSMARMSEAEASRMSIRVKRRLKELAYTGQYHGGPKPYGYEGPIKDENGDVVNRDRIGKAIINEEAAVIREAARRILNGESLRSVVIGLNDRGIPAPRGNLWTRRSLKILLTHPRVAGLRQHQGTVVGKARWPAILDHDTWERVRLVLLSPSRVRARTASRRYMLAGFVYCGKCGKRLVGMPYPNGTRAYGCDMGTTYRGCGGVRRMAEPIEALIREAILTRFDDSPTFLREVEATDDEDRQELPVKRQFAESRETVEDRIEVAKQILAELESATSRTTAAVPQAADSARQAWENASQSSRRALIDALITSIVVFPQATSTFNPDAIQITWRVQVAVHGDAHRSSRPTG